MKKIHLFQTLLVGFLLTFGSIPSQAGAYTSKSAFVDAFVDNGGGFLGVFNFDSLSGGEILTGTTRTVPNSLGNTGIIFPNLVTDPFNTDLNLMVVTNNGNNPTASIPNSLGTDDVDNYNLIVGGTNITFGLTNPVNGFDLSFITSDTLFDDDIRWVAKKAATRPTRPSANPPYEFPNYFL